MSRRPGQVAKWILGAVLRAVWVSTMVLTPLFGFWLASSLAAYQNASQWLALLGGLALFPLLPVGWEAIYAWRRGRQEQPKKQILTRLDRLVLRTLVINGLFLGGMLYASKATAFRALAVRGDWMLDGHHGPVASTLRGWLLGFADRLDQRDTQSGTYGKSDEAPDPSTVKPRRDEPRPDRPGATTAPAFESGWPLPDEADPKVANMPADVQASIEAVGAYLKEQFPDKKQRVKAIHDYVALRLTYDKAALDRLHAGDSANHPPQDAETVFATRTGVCEGYARLMVALGKAANVEIAYVTGVIRDAKRRLTAEGDTVKSSLQGVLHAWNAVLIDDEWFLIDTTWDDPIGSDQPVRSTYLFTPAHLFAYDHLPDDPAWQLAMTPMSIGDFARQPLLSPQIGRYGVTLEAPTRSQVTVDGEVTIVLDNPYGASILAQSQVDNGKRDSTPNDCDVKARAGTTKVEITCALPDGEHEVQMFAARAGERRHDYVGSILVNSH